MSNDLLNQAQSKTIEVLELELKKLSERYNYVCQQYENLITEKISLSVSLKISKEAFETKIKIKDNQIKALEEAVHRLEVDNMLLKHRVNRKKTSFFRNLFKF